MNKVLFPKKDYVKELGRIFKSSKNSQKLVKTLSKYHEKDIAEAITLLTPAERQHIYNVLDEHMIAEIFSYLDDAKDYLEELSLEKAARVVSYMDSDDAVDVLDDLSETKKNEIVEHLDADAKEDVQKLLSYEDDEIGSCMTNNFICIPDNLTISCLLYTSMWDLATWYTGITVLFMGLISHLTPFQTNLCLMIMMHFSDIKVLSNVL